MYYTYIHTHTYTHTYIHATIHPYMRTYIRMIHTFIHTHARTHARTHTRTHARTHARARTHTHTQVLAPGVSQWKRSISYGSATMEEEEESKHKYLSVYPSIYIPIYLSIDRSIIYYISTDAYVCTRQQLFWFVSHDIVHKYICTIIRSYICKRSGYLCSYICMRAIHILPRTSCMAIRPEEEAEEEEGAGGRREGEGRRGRGGGGRGGGGGVWRRRDKVSLEGRRRIVCLKYSLGVTN
jgi:hypothetical protein